jgi:hypothetical protein
MDSDKDKIFAWSTKTWAIQISLCRINRFQRVEKLHHGLEWGGAG